MNQSSIEPAPKAMSRIVFKLAPLALLAFLALGCHKSGLQRPATEGTTNPLVAQTAQNAQAYSYQGQEGKTALEILKANYQVETKQFSPGPSGEFVQSINGIKPDEKHFWAFYINGQQAQVGAGSYQTKSSDRIEWKLEEINNTN